MDNMIKVKTKAYSCTKSLYIMIDKYENGATYIGLFDKYYDCFDDISTYIFPVFPGSFYVEKGSAREEFCKEQKQLFSRIGEETKSCFNTYVLYELK